MLDLLSHTKYSAGVFSLLGCPQELIALSSGFQYALVRLSKVVEGARYTVPVTTSPAPGFGAKIKF